MTEKSMKFFEKHCRSIERFIAGEKKSQNICTTPGIVKALEEEYPEVKLRKTSVVNKDCNLNMYVVLLRDN